MLTVIVFLAVLSILVLIHEGGHLLAAKLSGVWVHQYSIGFGPDLIKYQGPETTYSFKPILFGGFVKMAGEDVGTEDERDEEVPESRKYYAKSPLVKGLISFSGPAMNVLTAVIIMILLVGLSGVATISIYGILEDSPSSGVLQPGDRILRIEGHRISSTRDINSIVQKGGQNSLSLTVQRGDQTRQFTVTPRLYPEEGRYMLGVELGPAASTVITAVKQDSSFGKAGLQSGDRLESIGGIEVDSWSAALRAVEKVGSRERISLGILRGQKELKITVAGPISQQKLMQSLSPRIVRQPVGPLRSIKLGVDNVKTILVLTYQGIRMIISGQIPAGEAVSGPVGIASYIGQGLNQGPFALFTIIALISLNLGIINLVPFPALDGSRIGFAIYEGIRGKPLPPEKEGLIHSIGFAILVGLLLFLTYKDILQLVR